MNQSPPVFPFRFLRSNLPKFKQTVAQLLHNFAQKLQDFAQKFRSAAPQKIYFIWGLDVSRNSFNKSRIKLSGIAFFLTVRWITVFV